MHHITPELLESSFRQLNRKAAPGVDGVTWDAYVDDLQGNLEDIHDRIQRGGYWVSPTKRAYIPKARGGRRPLGIATLEDKLVQRALTEVMNAIYEVDFLGFSYGFRPGRQPHQALDAVAGAITTRKVSWVLDADISGFFDAIDHDLLMEMLEHRIGDRRILRLIRKMLAAGVMEEGKWSPTRRGTPQGASLSPLLANVYLHYALDTWTHRWRQSEARGEVYIVRFADDFIVCFQYGDDAQRYRAALTHRLGEHHLELHPDKTRLLEFGRFATENRAKKGLGKPETFDFLGFTHKCAKNKKGKFTVRRKSIRKRVKDKLKGINMSLKRIRHRPIEEQAKWLRSVLRGWANYHAVPDNWRTVARFYDEVCRHWLRALRRRGQKHRMPWRRFRRILKRFLPRPQTTHLWPVARFYERLTRGRSPVR